MKEPIGVDSDHDSALVADNDNAAEDDNVGTITLRST